MMATANKPEILHTSAIFSLMETINILEGITGKEAKIEYIEKQKGDVRDTYADVGKAKAMLGYSPEIKIEEGLKKEVEWLKKMTVTSDEIICKHKLGFHSKTFKAMKERLGILMEDETLNRTLGENGKKYVKEEHDSEKIGKKLIRILMEM